MYLEEITVAAARIPMRPIMPAARVANVDQITKGRYRPKSFASSGHRGVFVLLVNGIEKEFAVESDVLLEIDVDLSKSIKLTADCTLKSGDVVLSGLSLEPVGP